jgi:uncharacterized damage-inducible protein DinB
MDLLPEMAKYSLWADLCIWEIVQSLSDEEFEWVPDTQSLSIRERYLHMVYGHSSFYCQWTGEDNKEDFPEILSASDLFHLLNTYNQKIMALLDTDGPTSMTLKNEQGALDFRLDEMIFTIINHSTYHRGQIVAMLRRLGREVPATDFVPYLVSKAMRSQSISTKQ